MPAPVTEPEAQTVGRFAQLSGPRKVSYVLFALLCFLAVWLHLGPMVLAGLFSYLIIDLAYRRLAQALPPATARWMACVIFVVASTAIGYVFWEFLRQAISAVPRIVAAALPRVADLAGRYGVELPFESLREIREVVLQAVRENALVVTRMTGLWTKRFFHVVVGVLAAVMCFYTEKEPKVYEDTLYDALRRELHDRLRTFMFGFEKVFGAQLLVSGINTLITAVFLVVMGIPHVAFLVPATFILGLLPVIGGVLSNAFIVSSALALSPRSAAIALATLMVLHKAEYIINSRIIGESIDEPMWVVLLGIIVGELIMGVPGIILAPAILHYARVELQALPAPRAARPG